MADQSKSPFSFGASTNSGSSGGLFGQQKSTGQSQGGLFGSTTNPTPSSGPGLFGTNTSTGGNSLFGSGTATTGQSQNIFGAGGGNGGGGTNKPAPSFNFGSKPAGGSGDGGSSLFGQAQSSTSQQPGTSAPFSGFATPNKPASSAGASSSLFGGAPSLFQNATSSAPGTTATPTSKFSFAPMGSTTPADPPPSNQPGGSSAFGLNLNDQQSGKKSLFPGMGSSTGGNQAPSQSSSAPSQNATGPGSGLFGNLGKPQSSSSSQPPASAGGNSLFTTLGSQTSAASSGNQAASTSLFSKPAQSLAADAQKPTFSFASASSQAPAQDTQKTQNNTPSLFNLGTTSKPPAATIPGASTNPFGNLGKSNETSASAAPPVSGSAKGMFASLGNAQETTSSSANTATSATQAPAPAKPSASNLFGKPNQATTTGAPFQPNAAASTNTAEGKGINSAAGGTLGQSTSGPAPSAQSRLKNKSMDEIITRWASDLAKYSKEFQKQAEKVATWDHMLVENSEKIQKLYGSTLEAERATAEVERQITAVENDQAELEAWLSKYEQQVDQMTSNSGDSYHRPDQERQRTYELAEKLSTRLDEMGKDLGSMIDEINDASSTLNKNTKPDDPLSQVVRVLNSHLTQLQQIDQGAAALQLKVAAAQKASQTLSPANGLAGPSSDAADSFYRSFMGRR